MSYEIPAYSQCLRKNGSINPDTPEGEDLMCALKAFFEAWDSSEQVEVEPIPTWKELADYAHEKGLHQVAPVIPAIQQVIGYGDDDHDARVDIVRWVRACAAIVEGRAAGPVEYLADNLKLLGAMYVDEFLDRESKAMEAEVTEAEAKTEAVKLPFPATGNSPSLHNDGLPDPDIPF